MDPSQTIRKWLKARGRDRYWLAEQTGFSKRTWDNWFAAKAFPKCASKLVHYMMQEGKTRSRSDEIKLTLEEWKLIDQASRALDCSIEDFIAMTLREKAEEILQESQ